MNATTTFNQFKATDKYQPFGFALWRSVLEDAPLQDVFGGSKTTHFFPEGIPAAVNHFFKKQF